MATIDTGETVDHYHHRHNYCPRCGSDSIECALAGCLPNDRGEVVDTNRAGCEECGWSGIVHDLTERPNEPNKVKPMAAMGEVGKRMGKTFILEPNQEPMAIHAGRGTTLDYGSRADLPPRVEIAGVAAAFTPEELADAVAPYQRPRNALVELPPGQTQAERHAEVVGLLRQFREEVAKHPTARHHIPTSYAFDRLLLLLTLSDGERAFVRAAADARHDPARQYELLLVFADWLEEQGREAVGARVRRLVPENGDVLVMTYPPVENPATGFRREEERRMREHLAERAEALSLKLEAVGRKVYVAVMPEGFDLRPLTHDELERAGLMTATTHNLIFKEVAHTLDSEPEALEGGLLSAAVCKMVARLKRENAAMHRCVRDTEAEHADACNEVASLSRRLREAVAAERRACAEIAANRGDRHGVGAAIAEAIRDRDVGEATP